MPNKLPARSERTKKNAAKKKTKKLAGAGAFNGATSKTKNKKSALSKKTKKA
tara:strand:- start:1290 stop:1445 length:156 start_codon:yes stop_codon:yes gene_type:complete